MRVRPLKSNKKKHIDIYYIYISAKVFTSTAQDASLNVNKNPDFQVGKPTKEQQRQHHSFLLFINKTCKRNII
jgi:hypothetical protein